MNVSKWTKLPLLIDQMDELFAALPKLTLYQVGKLTAPGEGELPLITFLDAYSSYVTALKSGEVTKFPYAPVLSVTDEAIEVMKVDGGRELIKPKLPVVQVQPYAFAFKNGEFHSQLFGTDVISWGLQFGYPQIFEDPQTHAIYSTRDLPNGPLFRVLQKWVRAHTSATPINGKNLPIRLGKTCFSWINHHPQLKTQGLHVDRKRDSHPLH